jgi:aspartyl-tRNA(Asn)/glutamyl-tRNA(Gln) amidotransferase subunit C
MLMAQRLSEADVRKIAALARLELSTGEVELFSKQLADILAYADELGAADTTGIPPTSHPHAIEREWRPDELLPTLDRDLILDRAPGGSRKAGLFKVPKVL